FFVASSAVVPSPEEGVYISNIRIAAGEADARSVLIKQLMEEGSVVTNDIQFTNQNEITAESQPVIDQLGQVLQENPDMNIQINSVEETPGGVTGNEIINKEALKQKAEKIKAYIVNKFKIKIERIITDAKVKIGEVSAKNKTVGKAKEILTEIIRL
ncbi:MAG: OmpA family protein, partial [Ferruginibacter sp.]|nr:OmpA family protein [Chitinophagaceae bacterium]